MMLRNRAPLLAGRGHLKRSTPNGGGSGNTGRGLHLVNEITTLPRVSTHSVSPKLKSLVCQKKHTQNPKIGRLLESKAVAKENGTGRGAEGDKKKGRERKGFGRMDEEWGDFGIKGF